MKKAPSLKTLVTAISSLMAMTALTAQSAKASDVEIYQAARDGDTTLMLLLDISGSMNAGNAGRDDYNLRSGNGPQYGNDYVYINSNILNAARSANPTLTGTTYITTAGVYTTAWYNAVLASGRYGGSTTRAQFAAEWNKYIGWSPNSYCQTAAMTRYRETGWQPTLITETTAETGRTYTRDYCRVPVDATTINSRYWSNAGGTAVGASWIMDPIIGCPMYTAAGDITTIRSNATHRRCYSRIDRLKDALWDVINGNPAKGITPLGDDIVLGISTLGLMMKNTVPWSPTSPLDSGAGRWWHRDLGAIRIPARPLGEMVGGITQRQVLLNYLGEMSIGASTPTARSYAEAASYLLGTTTQPSGQLRETDLVDTGTGGHRTCVRWGTTPITTVAGAGTVLPCTEWDYANNTNGGNSSWQFIDGYAIDPSRFTGRHRLAGTRNPNGSANSYTGADELLWVSRVNGRIFYSYDGSDIQSPSGFPMSSVDSKTSDLSRYQAPTSVVNQANPECSGQGIYVLSDGQPSGRPNEIRQMRLALGTHGNSFTCGGGFRDIVGQADGLRNDWDCITTFAETLLDPTKNPSGISFKTAAVGFAREYTQGGLAAYDRTLGKDEPTEQARQAERIRLNLARIPTSDNSDIANFARWGIRGDGGWYAGSSSQSVVDSINAFVQNLTVDIPEVVTGQPFIPIDPLNPLTYMKNAYYGTFKPKVGSGTSFWAGDINKYAIKEQALYGADGTSRLFNPSNGLLNAGVLGYWGTGATSKLPLRTGSGRQVFTDIAGSSNNPLTKVTINELYRGTLNSATHRNAWLNLLGYSVGLSGDTAEADLTGKPELRQLGALMHSTPIILTQSGSVTRSGGVLDTSAGRTDYLLYGSTQGILHVIDSATGVEKVAFVPQELMNDPTSKQNFQSAGATVGQLTYGIDGQWTAYTQYVPATGGGFTVNGSAGATSTNLNGKGLQWVYGGMRMGGRSYYGLDLSDIDSPAIKFHINPNAAGVGTPLSYMGQSWSKPTLGFVKWNGTRRLVMFVGGGYDMGYEDPKYDQTNGVGAGVYMFDAHDGSLLWWGSSHATTSTGGTTQSTNNANLKYSVAGNIATYDRNSDGFVDNLYFGDLGGQVFRVDLDNNYNYAGGDNLVSRVVRLYNGHQSGGLSPRFYDAPSFSAHSGLGADGQFGIVSIASGNKSSPVSAKDATSSARDALFVIYDQDVLRTGIVKKAATPYVLDANVDNLAIMTSDIMTSKDETKNVKAVDGSTRNQGWKYYLTATPGKIKGNNTPRVVDNFLFLDTYTPEGGTVTQSSCGAGILGESYQELFCLPGGVCNNKQADILDIGSPITITEGSFARNFSGIGLVNPAIGNATNNPNQLQIFGPTGGNIDCSDAANKSNPVCINQVSSITNKPVRWYENTPRS